MLLDPSSINGDGVVVVELFINREILSIKAFIMILVWNELWWICCFNRICYKIELFSVFYHLFHFCSLGFWIRMIRLFFATDHAYVIINCQCHQNVIYHLTIVYCVRKLNWKYIETKLLRNVVTPIVNGSEHESLNNSKVDA